MGPPGGGRQKEGDWQADLRSQVLAAVADRRPLRIVGGDSKPFYARASQGDPLELAGHRGIMRYQPTELVLTARSGTSLEEIDRALAEHNQMLGFEPPRFDARATLGGTLACGLSGPRRPYAGSARDFMLGCKLLNGRGEVLRFGGEVIKNVAGFDVTRLMAGALGTLGVLLEVSMKVIPRPRSERTLCFELPFEDAIERMSEWARRSLPISAMAYDGRLRVRLSGGDAAVAAAAAKLGGDGDGCSSSFWTELREQRLPFFAGVTDLWRVSVAPATRSIPVSGEWLLDWGGALRWLRTDSEPAAVFSTAAKAGGHASRFRTNQPGPRFQPLPGNLFAIHRALKQAFDPHRILNVGALYEDL
jgi:glycolate oxidase FAD binding subunit